MKILSALAVTLILGAGIPSLAQEDPRYLMIQARALQRWGKREDPQGAAALYRKVITLMPASAQAQLRLSETLMESGNLAEAVAPALKATELDPSSGEAWAHLGMLYYVQAQTSASARPLAAGALRRAVRLLPGDSELWTRCAEMEEGLQDEAGALRSWLSVGRLRATASYRGRLLADFAWERALELAVKLNQYEARREAVLALCAEPPLDNRRLRFLEDLVQYQVDAGFLGHAEESFELLSRDLPHEPATFENLAIIQMRTGRFETALAALAKAEAMHTSPRLSYNVGFCLMKLGRFSQAEKRWKDLQPALATTDEDPGLRLAVKVLYASSLMLQDRPQEMLDLSASWPEATSNAEVLGLRAQAFIQTQAWEAARAALKEGMKTFPGYEVFLRAKDIPPKLFEERLFSRNESRKALTQLNLEAMAGMCGEFNSWDRCLALAREARKAAPVRDVELLLLEANALENLGRSDQAMAVLREGQRLNPGHPTVQNNLGFLLLDKGGDLKEATRLIEAALKQEPRNGSTMDSWGWALFKNGEYARSEDVLRKAAALTPDSPEVHRHLGEALLKLDRLQEALDEWDRALAFAFPDRKALEDQAQALRTRLAKGRNAETQSGAEPEPASEETEEEDEP